MPSRLKSPCNEPSCRATCVDRFCDRCKPKHPAWAGRGGVRKSTTERGYGTRWQKLRVYILDRDKGLCQPCRRGGRVVVAVAVDHIVPKGQGGTDDETNLEGICKACHDVKTQTETHGKTLGKGSVSLGRGSGINCKENRV